MSRFQKLLALLLCAAMLFALLPAFAAAEDGKNDEPATELPEVEDAEPAEDKLPPESEETALAEETPSDGDTELPEIPTDDPVVTVLDEPLETGGNTYTISEPGETVFRPITAEDDGYYKFLVNSDHVRFWFTDSEFNVLLEAETEVDYAQQLQAYTYRDGGQTYYVGVSFQDPERTGSFSVLVYQYAANACGDDMTWYFDEETGELSLSSRATSPMWDFTPETVPWSAYREQIKTLRLPSNGTIIIGQYAFYGCSNLESINSVNNLGGVHAYAFYGTGLRELVWTKRSYTGIGAYAFADCKNLKTFIVSQNNWSYGIGDYAFYGSGLETASFGYELTRVGSYAFAECKDLISVSLPNEHYTYRNDIAIGDYTFQNSGLQSFSIPKIVTEIGVGIFAGCKDLTSLAVDPENTAYTVQDGLLLSKDGRTLVAAPYRIASGAYTTPNGIRAVADSAFYGCGALSELTISPGITTVGENAFTDCAALKQITIPLTTKTVKTNAAQNCGAITDVYYLGTEEERNEKLTVGDGNDALLAATWHYQEPCTFDGTLEWNPEDVQFKGSTAYTVWTGSALTPRFTLKDAEGVELDPAAYTFEYRENVAPGTAYLFITFTEGYAGTLRMFFKIYLPATTATSVENREDGIYLTWEPVEGADGYVIYRRAWNLVSAGWTDFVRWNNTTETTWTDTTVYAGTRYQYGIKAYFNQRMDPVTGALFGGNVGDNFNLGMVGPLKTTVRITTRELISLTSGSKTIKAIWSGSNVFTGYELRYATDASFTKNVRNIRISDPKTTETTLKSLTNGTAYYVKVRSYHFFDGMTYYGQWSHSICIKPGSTQTLYNVQYRALCVGQCRYDTSPLKGCVNDMTAMEGMLKGLKQPAKVTTLKNAKKAQIINAIRTAYADADDNDVSIFTYSGHGVNAHGDATYQGALVGVDLQYLTFKELATELSKVRGHVIVILDSCHSGAAIDKDGESWAEAFNSAVIEAFAEADTLQAKSGELAKSKFTVITAASGSRSSYEGKFDGSGYFQGAFTAAVIKGMGCKYTSGSYSGKMPADNNNDKLITLNEFYNYAYSQARSWVGQYAQYYGDLNRVLFSRK